MELVQELHKRDIWILLDVAINSMAINGPLEQMSFEKVIPFNDASFFHPHCWVDYESNDIESVQNVCQIIQTKRFFYNLDLACTSR